MNQNEAVLGVSALNRYIKGLIESDDVLSYVSVRGEISNFKYHTSGHLYFTLKDEESEIAAVMFRSAASGLRFAARNGMRVTAYGKVSVYEKSGRYQLYISTMLEDGIGSLYLEYKRLYESLRAEGLFAEERKRPLPSYPHRIGVITSPTGAAIRDILNITGRRYPAAKILIYPSLVQGREAPASLCHALAYLNAETDCDVIILGRGGGSMEDLWAFNDEALVRAVANSRIPVISAVGHETDFTLCDFAADRRAPTPSAAAELAVPDRYELMERLDELFGRLDMQMERFVERRRTMLKLRVSALALVSPEAKLATLAQKISAQRERIDRAMQTRMLRERERMRYVLETLQAMNPLAVLERGYGAVLQNGRFLSSVKKLKCGDRVTLRLSDGSADAQILSVAPLSPTSPKINEGKE